MLHIDVERLRSIGLTPALAQALHEASKNHDCADGHAARVIELHRDSLLLHDGRAPLGARAHPRLLAQCEAAGEPLVVGDWVVARRTPPDPNPWVLARAAALTRLVRRDAEGRRHALVSNVDLALIVMGLDGDFNPRRIERYVTLVLAAGIAPLVVLTKRDWAGDAVADDEADALRARLGGSVPVLAVDGTHPAAAASLAPWLGAGQTAVLIGSSGAGKSTLANTLLGRAVQDTGAVRAADSRGKHTTTARSLHCLPGGACLIDTPGVRTLLPDADPGALAAAFADIEALAAHCRFRDCRHENEPGCAVRAGVDADRLANWRKLGRELRRDTLTPLERQREVATWKARQRGADLRARLKRGEE